MQRVRHTPDALALACGNVALTYAELCAQARRRAEVLVAAAAHAEDAAGADGRCGDSGSPACIAFLAGNSIEYALWLVAALACGIAFVPLNTRLSIPELAAQIADCKPFFVLSDEANLAAARGSVQTAVAETLCPAPPVARFDDALAAHPRPAAPDDPSLPSFDPFLPSFDPFLPSFNPARISNIVYTSGSTGRAKGVLQTYGNHAHSALNCQRNLGFLAASDVWGCPTPLFHMSGLSIIMRSLVCGVGVRLYERFDAGTVNDDALNGRVTCLSAVTYQIERMLDDLAVRAPGSVYPATLRFVLQGGGPLPAATLARCRDAHMRAVQSFGMTETASQVVALSPTEALDRPGSAGRPLSGVQLCIGRRGAAPSDEPANPGDIGRILVKSPTLAAGYLNQPGRYAASFTEHGWFDTGDLGRIDKDGYLYVVCRMADLIISGGENVYPAEVEAVVARHPRVAQVAVVGIADPHWGSIPVAVCTPAGDVPDADADAGDDAGDDEMRSFCRPSLAAYKCPRHVVWVPQLPTTASGKLRRGECARIAADALARRRQATA